MIGKRRSLFVEAPLTAAFALAVCVVLGTGSAGAQQIQYMDDGAVANSRGGWDLPLQGSCPADLTQPTRPDCIALRFPAFTSSATCVTPVGGVVVRAWSSSYCNDLVNNADQATCESHPDRKWSNGVCSIVLRDDDRNDVTCGLHGGTWGGGTPAVSVCIGAWVMPQGNLYTPTVLTWNGTSAPGPGDQCLRCHNDVTQYNGPRVRDTEETLFMGHKNMARKVSAPREWGGPDFSCTGAAGETEDDCVHNGGTWDPTIYPSTDSGQVFDWMNGTVLVNGVAKPLYWIFGDWLSALPRAIYADDPDTTQNPDKPKVAYSCARCHTTGWASSATNSIYGVGAMGTSTREPEKSFPNITWDGVADAVTGQVNFASGVTGDTGKMASWDVFGITCTRCHSAAINRTSTAANGFSAPTGMSTHHSTMTAPDSSSGSGYCTDSRWTAQAQCDAAGAAWLTACSVAGMCSNPAFTTSGTCLANAGTWTKYDTSAVCTGAGGTWYTASCDVAGICNKGTCSIPAHANQMECVDNGGTWTSPATSGDCTTAGGAWYAATDVIRCEDAGGRWTGSKTQRGQIITSLCMNCHRQETAGNPYDKGTDPAGLIKAGPVHGTVEFNLHFHGNQFLNSPHAKFTGAFNEIATGQFNYAMTGAYKSFFMTEAEAANTGNSCTGCHEVHTSTVAGEHPFRAECTECHTKNLGLVMHPTGPGTPLEEMDTEPFETCVSCHMPKGQHLFRINTSASYSSIPMPAAMSGTVNANTSPDGNYAPAVWVDLDNACGQCHGGGTAQAKTTGTVAAGSAALTVASATGLTVGQKVRVTGAGSLYYDDTGAGQNADFDTFVKAVAGNTVTLAGNATKAVTSAMVVQNATKNSAGYISKVRLAELAAGMHNDKPQVSFSYTLGTPNTLTVNVNATATLCSGSATNCDAYEWVWGDGTPDGSGVTASHTYATAGAKTITLTAHEYGVGEASKSKTVNVYAPDNAPVVGGTACGSILDANTWLATIADTSTDDVGVAQVTVNWGDGSVLSNDRAAPFGPFTHTYLNPGSFTITHKAIDTIGQQNSRTCTVAPAYFAVSGTVFRSDGTTVVPTALITVKKGTTTVRTVYTAANGTFSAGSLKPGTYTLTVSKAGLTFALPAATITVGPSSAGNIITATAGRK